MTDLDDVGSRPILDPTTQQFIDLLEGGMPLDIVSPAEARAALTLLQSAPVGKPSVRIRDKMFPVGPTGAVSVRIVRPRETAAGYPVIMYFHGGGWVLGDKITHDRLVRQLATEVGAVLFFVEYDRAPEAQYPTAIEQAYAAMQYVVEHALTFRVDATRLAVVGDGVGGTLAAAVTLLAKQRRGPKIDLQVLFYPVTDARFDTASYETFADGPWLTRAAMQRFWDAYLPDLARRQEIIATPLNASIDQLRNLPDALVIVAENDVLRDEGEAYARKLSDAGVRVSSVRYNGTIHDFVLLNELADTPAVGSAIAQAVGSLKLAFG
jgi:acetyl esterase